MTRLWGVFVNGIAARDALARWQFGMVFDSTDQQIECVLRMGLDKFELRECQPEGFYVVAVLDLVLAFSRAAAATRRAYARALSSIGSSASIVPATVMSGLRMWPVVLKTTRFSPTLDADSV